MIELAKLSDLPEIMNIINEAIEEMREDKNPQWGSTEENYPNEERFKKDIVSMPKNEKEAQQREKAKKAKEQEDMLGEDRI